jgi:iron(III)-enterobactin esterase
MPLETYTLKSTSRLFSRKVWYRPSSTPAKRIAIFLDAEIYLDAMDASSLVRELEAHGEIPPTACLFVSNLNAEARHHDFTCSDPYADFVANDLVRWMKNRTGLDTGNHLIGGVSLSGLQAVYTALAYPHLFSAALCQSGSFWWENEWLRRHLRELFPNPGKFWLSVGTKEKGAGHIHTPELIQEIDQDLGVRNFSEALKQNGSQVRNHLYDGGHDSTHWKNELPDALKYLLVS